MVMIVTAKIATADKPNKNGHVYSRDVLETAIREYQSKQLFGYLGMPEYSIDDAPPNNEVSHAVTDMHFNENGDLVGTIRVFDTSEGARVRQLLSEAERNPSFSVGLAMAGTGHVVDKGDGVHHITDFKLLSVNYVSDPA